MVLIERVLVFLQSGCLMQVMSWKLPSCPILANQRWQRVKMVKEKWLIK